MFLVSGGPIRGECPECGEGRRIEPADLGREVVCDRCRTPFVVVRERVRRRVPRSPRPRDLETVTGGAGRPPRPGLRRLCLVLGVAIGVGLVAALVAVCLD